MAREEQLWGCALLRVEGRGAVPLTQRPVMITFSSMLAPFLARGWSIAWGNENLPEADVVAGDVTNVGGIVKAIPRLDTRIFQLFPRQSDQPQGPIEGSLPK